MIDQQQTAFQPPQAMSDAIGSDKPVAFSNRLRNEEIEDLFLRTNILQ